LLLKPGTFIDLHNGKPLISILPPENLYCLALIPSLWAHL